jgi:hypothetical protein
MNNRSALLSYTAASASSSYPRKRIAPIGKHPFEDERRFLVWEDVEDGMTNLVSIMMVKLCISRYGVILRWRSKFPPKEWLACTLLHSEGVWAVTNSPLSISKSKTQLDAYAFIIHVLMLFRYSLLAHSTNIDTLTLGIATLKS